MNEADVKKRALEISDEIIGWRRELHACPELHMKNPQAAAIILRVLKEIGITDIRTDIGGEGATGIAAMIYGGKPGKCLAIRADTDGLPVVEETGLPFASTNGNMHACGHDAHTAMALGVAKILYENRESLCGSVKMIFQPCEEYGFGAKNMVADGVLENPHVDAIIGQHTGNLYEGFEGGEIGYPIRHFGFCNSMFRAVFHGKAGHTSMQHHCVDAIAIACYAVTQLQMIMARERDCFKCAIISVGTIEGGEKNNIIADTCTLTGSIRCDNEEDQTHYLERVSTIFNSVATSMGGTCDINFPFRLRTLNVNQEMEDLFIKSAGKIVPPEKVKPIVKLNTVAEDFSEFCDETPGMFFFHCSTFGDDRDHPHHHPCFTVNEEYLHTGTAVMTQFAFDWQEYKKD